MIQFLRTRIDAVQNGPGPLHSPDFRRLLTSNALWWTTRFMEMIVVGWLVLELTDSAWMVALVDFFRSAPFLLLGFLSGPITDRWGRRPIIVAAQTANFLTYGAIFLLLWLDMLQVWHLGLAGFVMGTAWALDWPARRALVPDLVGKGHTVDALLMENFSQGLARMAGPWLGGWLIATAGATGCFLIMVILSLMTLAILRSLAQQDIPRTSTVGSSTLNTIGQGLRYVRGNQPILAVLLVTIVMNFLVFPYAALLPIFARDILHQGPVGLGWLGTASGIGSFAGLFLINRIRHWASNGWIFLAGTFGQCLMLLLFSFSTVYPLSIAALILSGIGQACFGIMQSSIILLAASDEMRSRAMGALVLAIGSGPLGRLQTGVLAENLGTPTAVGLQAALGAIALVAILFGLPEVRRTPTAQIPAPAPEGG